MTVPSLVAGFVSKVSMLSFLYAMYKGISKGLSEMDESERGHESYTGSGFTGKQPAHTEKPATARNASVSGIACLAFLTRRTKLTRVSPQITI